MSTQVLRYPQDIIDATTDYFFLEVLEYKPGGLPGFSSNAGANETTKNANKVKASIILPMPDSIGSVNKVGWGDSRISALAGAGLNIAGLGVEAVTGGKVTQESVLNQIPSGDEYDGIRKYFKSKASIEIVNAVAGTNIGLNDVLGRQAGQIVNQNLELLFGSVSIRPFGFNWDITPRSETESQQVLQIIKTLKKAMSAKKQGNAFLVSPDVFRISYRTGQTNHKYLNKFKICAMQDIGVDYTGSGAYATYPDGTPVHYRLSLAFQELEPIYANDYDTTPTSNTMTFDDAGY